MSLFRRNKAPVAEVPPPIDPAAIEGVQPIADVEYRHRAKVAGRVRSIRVQPWAGVPTLEVTLLDESGGIGVVFLGRREVPGIHCGTTMVVEGMVADHQGRLAIMNPDYQLLPAYGH